MSWELQELRHLKTKLKEQRQEQNRLKGRVSHFQHQIDNLSINEQKDHNIKEQNERKKQMVNKVVQGANVEEDQGKEKYEGEQKGIKQKKEEKEDKGQRKVLKGEGSKQKYQEKVEDNDVIEEKEEQNEEEEELDSSGVVTSEIFQQNKDVIKFTRKYKTKKLISRLKMIQQNRKISQQKLVNSQNNNNVKVQAEERKFMTKKKVNPQEEPTIISFKGNLYRFQIQNVLDAEDFNAENTTRRKHFRSFPMKSTKQQQKQQKSCNFFQSEPIAQEKKLCKDNMDGLFQHIKLPNIKRQSPLKFLQNNQQSMLFASAKKEILQLKKQLEMLEKRKMQNQKSKSKQSNRKSQKSLQNESTIKRQQEWSQKQQTILIQQQQLIQDQSIKKQQEKKELIEQKKQPVDKKQPFIEKQQQLLEDLLSIRSSSNPSSQFPQHHPLSKAPIQSPSSNSSKQLPSNLFSSSNKDPSPPSCSPPPSQGPSPLAPAPSHQAPPAPAPALPPRVSPQLASHLSHMLSSDPPSQVIEISVVGNVIVGGRINNTQIFTALYQDILAIFVVKCKTYAWVQNQRFDGLYTVQFGSYQLIGRFYEIVHKMWG